MKFSDIPGNIKLKENLIRSVNDNRISHALLFFGPEGSASLALAVAYAQFINCARKSENDSCGECPSCRKYSKLVHPDLHFIYPVNKTKDVDEKKVTSKDLLVPWREFLKDSYYSSLFDWYEKIEIEKKQGLISAEDASNINSTLSYKAYEAEYKVMIIWMVEKMKVAAANKVLKILEEPPDKTLFILITEDYNQLLKTITSRAQLIKVSKFEDKDIEAVLQQKYELSPEKSREVAFYCNGNLGKALKNIRMGAEDVAVSEHEWFSLFREWMRACFTIKNRLKDYDKLQATINSVTGEGSREKLKDFLTYSLEMLSSCLQYGAGNRALVRSSGEELKFIRDFSPFVHFGNIKAMEKEINKAIFHIERNAQPSIIVTDLSHRISSLLSKSAGATN